MYRYNLRKQSCVAMIHALINFSLRPRLGIWGIEGLSYMYMYIHVYLNVSCH